MTISLCSNGGPPETRFCKVGVNESFKERDVACIELFNNAKQFCNELECLMHAE